MTDNYIIITPVKDEEVYLPNLINCMLRQTLKPLMWYIVDDGSIDNTVNIMNELGTKIRWCKLIYLPFRARRIRGQAVVNAIMKAYYDSINDDYKYIIKVDADITFNDNLLESLISKMNEDIQLGICGPELHILRNKQWEVDRILPKDIVRGAIRVYRKSCFASINGLVPRKGWDGIDQIKAKAMGWKVERFFNLISYHAREMGNASGVIKSSIENGRGSYYMGSRFFYMIKESIQFGKQKPYFIRGVFMIIGYMMGYILQDRINDSSVISFLRNQNKNV